MVTIMPSNPWRYAEFLERIRPGIAVSAALHIGLFVLLAYVLAFRPVLQVPTDPGEPPVQYFEIPKPAPPKITPPDSKFKPVPTPHLDYVRITSAPLPIPASQDFHRRAPEVQAALTPQPPVIIDPRPISRGGLVYPDRAAEVGKEGYVDFDFIIEPDGSVGSPRVVAEVPDGYGFAAAAKKAFSKWRFEPMTKDGHPVAAPAHIRVTFKLQ
jgi:TonB family protein